MDCIILQCFQMMHNDNGLFIEFILEILRSHTLVDLQFVKVTMTVTAEVLVSLVVEIHGNFRKRIFLFARWISAFLLMREHLP